MSIVAVEELSYRYAGAATPALECLSFTIDPGEFVVIAGSSGSGKSSLLRAVAGLVPHFYGGEFAGEVTTAGRSTRDHGPGDLAAVVASLFQDPETQIVMGTARAELAFALENRGLPPAAVARAVEETALALAIEPLLDRPTDELSGGELQRVALGATLAVRPAVVCLDEPTSQLDPVAGDELIGLLRRLNDDRELTVLLAEHRLERCLPYADRVIAMDRGRIGFDGTPVAFLEWALRFAPALATPGAKLLGRLGLEPAAGVRHARAVLRASAYGCGLDVEAVGVAGGPSLLAPVPAGGSRRLLRHRRAAEPFAIRFSNVWHELAEGPAILRDLSLVIGPGERVALMGRNGAGKSTLLRHAAGLLEPTRGNLQRTGRVALVLQNPNDYLVHETVAQEAPGPALERFGLDLLVDRHPRDLSGGEKQRLALAIVLGADAGSSGASGASCERPAAVCLDEPTRGMDRTGKDDLARTLCALEAAVVVATHDPEFAAAFADRVVLLADGAVIATGPTSEVLSGGTYFATETARILGGEGGVLLPDAGAELLLALADARAGAELVR